MRSSDRSHREDAETDADSVESRVRELDARVRELEATRARLEQELAAARAAAARAPEAGSDRAQREWLEAVLNSMTEEVYFTDLDRRYTYLNPAALREFGHQDVRGMPLHEIVSKLEVLRADGTPRPLEEAPPLRALGGEVVRDEEQMVRIPRTGEVRHRQVSSGPVRNAAGQIIGSVSIVRDVTELKRTNQALRAADRRKDEFLATLAHELRNRLVPIGAGVEMLQDGVERPEIVSQVLPMMERQLGVMMRLIDDILDVSRFASDRIELRRESATIASLVTHAVEANRHGIAERDLDLVLDLAEPDRALWVDPTRMTQVIASLLANATKFTPPGGRIEIRGRIAPSEAGSPELLLSVADSGIGMDASVLPRVFELFFRDSSNGVRTGLGVGLALARRLVELHGGSITADSPGVGHGSTFTVRIPALVDRRSGVPASNKLRSLERHRVLVIDDNEDSADAMALLVGTLGAEVRTAYGGEAGLEVLRHFEPTVVLLDLGMPRLDGYETCRRIRWRLGGSVRVIAVSGRGQEQDRARAAAAGFDAHLAKPARAWQLAEAILSVQPRAG